MRVSWVVIITALVLSGCQTPTSLSSCRYTERDLTVPWASRQYWCWPAEVQSYTPALTQTLHKNPFSEQEDR